jgi:2'-5' RNA ligase
MLRYSIDGVERTDWTVSGVSRVAQDSTVHSRNRDRMRLFIGLTFPKKQRQRIHRAARLLRDEELPVRWVDLENYHVTLKFLGEVRRETVSSIEAAMTKVASATASFSAEFGGFGAFPTIRQPRMLWLGVCATGALRCLKQDLEWAMGDCGFEAETRAFHPHITLGRADDRIGAGVFRGLDQLVADMEFSAEVKVRTIDLIRSNLSKDGARYSVLSSAKLAT